MGDACDDRDSDGRPDAVNSGQLNFGGDDRGDDCEDRDGDGILDIRDNCGAVGNAN